MAKVHGKNADFAISDDSISADVALPTSETDVLYDYAETTTERLETLSNEISLSIESRTEDTTPYGTDFDEFDVMTYNWSYDVTCFYDDTDGVGSTERLLLNGLLNLWKKRFLFSPAGKPGGESSSTQPKYLGRVIIASASPNPARGGMSMIRASIKGDGALIRTITS